MPDKLDSKLNKLRDILKSYQSVVVAYSGGVDSTFLLRVAGEVMGNRVLAVTVSSGLMTSRELREAESMAAELGVEHQIVEMDEIQIEGISENSSSRCYHCKRHIFSLITEIAANAGFGEVVDASNLDDTLDYRPGMEAIREMRVKTPLIDAGMSKGDIRELSRRLSIPGWDRPANSCLASRIPYGQRITPEKLRRVEKGEELLHECGFVNCRLRHHGDIARIEIEPADFEKLLNNSLRKEITGGLKKLGFIFVTLDLEGYRRGSLNESLDKD
jgi:uncharacterized protein